MLYGLSGKWMEWNLKIELTIDGWIVIENSMGLKMEYV